MSNSWICETCGNGELVDGNNGFFYCSLCNSQTQDFKDTGVADEDFYDETGDAQGGLYSARNTRRVNVSAVKPEPLSQPLDNNPLSQTNMENDNAAADAVGPTEPEDFGFDTVEGYYSEVRLRMIGVTGLLMTLRYANKANLPKILSRALNTETNLTQGLVSEQ